MADLRRMSLMKKFQIKSASIKPAATRRTSQGLLLCPLNFHDQPDGLRSSENQQRLRKNLRLVGHDLICHEARYIRTPAVAGAGKGKNKAKLWPVCVLRLIENL